MSPWGRWILERLGLDPRGLFVGWRIIEDAKHIYGIETVSLWCSRVLRKHWEFHT